MNSYHELPEHRLLRRAQRLQQLINREPNGMRVAIYAVGQPEGNDTPAVDMDETPNDIDADVDEGDDHEA